MISADIIFFDILKVFDSFFGYTKQCKQNINVHDGQMCVNCLTYFLFYETKKKELRTA